MRARTVLRGLLDAFLSGAGIWVAVAALGRDSTEGTMADVVVAAIGVLSLLQLDALSSIGRALISGRGEEA